ncbi:MAG TPA: NAD+ synthase [Solirubrobacteraceae bacterium]|nr:NAD+ synthase [Solirubrobacteraceae bacterium]
MRLALCQINATVGDIAGNARRILDGIEAARGAGAELVLFPELALTGYPPEDLLLREHFLADARIALEELAAHAHGLVAVVGFPERAEAVYNAAAVLSEGRVRSVYRKVHLPNYGVFDEQRYFKPGHGGATIEVGSERVGLTVCEDLWLPGPPASEEALAGARLIVNISASPYHAGKGLERERLFAERAREHGTAIAFCALVGGQDELLFDGHSFVLDAGGETIARAAQFEEELLLCDLEHGGPVREQIAPREAEVYAALTLGLRDYVEKNGFAHVVLGLSGGIDSALVACVAVDALGVERVSVAIMPSPYSSAETQGDARALAANLEVRTHELPIAEVMDAYGATLAGDFAGRGPDVTEENLQARIRGNLLMALSNKFGWLVLTTGNKSEMSVGYTTLYGDLAGGFAVIKDVPKTLVYRLCEWRDGPEGAVTAAGAGGGTDGRIARPIPASIIQRAPSAELRVDQRDEDSLPPYELLDPILRGYVELDEGREQLIARGFPEREVDRTIRLVDLAEYKRRQAPPGIKLSTRAFGRDRRMPITNRYRG